MQDHPASKLVEASLQSFDGMQRATPKPFLLARVMAAVNREAGIQNAWGRINNFLSRPAIAFCSLLLILMLNAAIIYFGKRNSSYAVATQTTGRDEFASNLLTIYDIENQEP